jgi:hypothetical protein
MGQLADERFRNADGARGARELEQCHQGFSPRCALPRR